MAKETTKLVAGNKKAFHEYFIEEKYEAGISLAGTEVKSLRMGKCSIKEAFVRLYRGENMYKAVNGATVKQAYAGMLQGFTEQSNVNVIDQMVSMITITRAYEAGQKMIQTQDNLIGKAVTEVGKL